MKTLRTTFMLMFGLLLLIGLPAEAQKKKKKKGETETITPKKEEKKTIAEETKKHSKMEGLFTIYQDSTTGKVKMAIREDQIGKEYIYFGQVKDGVLEAGAFRGAYDGEFIFKINKYFNRLEIEKVNTGFYFDENNALSRSAEANIAKAIMASEEVIVEEDGVYLIDADNLFVKETLTQIKGPGSQNPNAFKLGSASKEKTKILSIKNYPENLNVAVQYAYDNSAPKNNGGNAVTDARYVSVEVFYTLLEVPENDYQPRMDDPRVGYFLNQVNNQTDPSATPYRDMINRWNLVKKDPDAAVSEPVEPITWWIENTTPMEWRETITEGVLAWNPAFEKAGFKNAMVVKIQPDDANWDAGDIRFNVLRWTSSPNPPFGGYGPSFTNPRTGQILGADIMLEFVHFSNRVKYTKLFDLSMAEENDFTPIFGRENNKFCSAGDFMQQNLLFGHMVNESAGDDMEMTGMKKEAMMYLILHEVGHTLGLNHNMKSSQMLSPKELENIQSGVLLGSIMDYPAINVTRDRSKQGNYYAAAAGPYDTWAIQFGYQPFENDAEKQALLAMSTRPELAFGNDADDMRSSGKAIDPRVNTGDLSNDAIGYSIDRFETVSSLMKDLKSKTLNDGDTYQELRQNFYILSGQYSSASRVVSRYIGGVYVDRSLEGQASGSQPFTPVSYADQKRAMSTLSKYVFAPDAWNAPDDLYNYLAMQRRGYNFFSSPEDPKIHSLVLSIQNQALNHLLHYNVQQRLVDSELYGNTYDLGEMMTALNDAIFKADISGSVNTFRQNLQIEYTNKLADIVGDDKNYTHTSRSMALYNLRQIDRMASNSAGNTLSKAHKQHLKLIVASALDQD